jgi:hypothetical protein
MGRGPILQTAASERISNSGTQLQVTDAGTTRARVRLPEASRDTTQPNKNAVNNGLASQLHPPARSGAGAEEGVRMRQA